jgi:hypothetical protein
LGGFNQFGAPILLASGSVTLLLGNGDGTFNPGVQVDSGQSFFGVTAAPLTRNGKANILASAEFGVDVLLNNGDGTFRRGAGIVNGLNGGAAMAVADFNGDGKTDLALFQNAFLPVTLLTYFGDGQGGFTPAGSFPLSAPYLPGSSGGIGIGDFTAADTSDIVVAGADGSATALVFPNLPPPSNQVFVSQLYQDLLHRQADPGGLSGWINFLNQGVSRMQVTLDIESSAEYRTIEVEGLYSKVLNRAADSAGLQAWVNFLMQGGTIDQAEAFFIASPEYLSQHSSGPWDNNGFVTAVYQTVLNRNPDPGGLQSWSQTLANGAAHATVALDIIGSQESAQDIVEGMYLTYLHRVADPGGLAAFTNLLLSGAPPELAAAIIIGSPEYFADL